MSKIRHITKNLTKNKMNLDSICLIYNIKQKMNYENIYK
jgi:hypothetical protein